MWSYIGSVVFIFEMQGSSWSCGGYLFSWTRGWARLLSALLSGTVWWSLELFLLTPLSRGGLPKGRCGYLECVIFLSEDGVVWRVLGRNLFLVLFRVWKWIFAVQLWDVKWTKCDLASSYTQFNEKCCFSFQKYLWK